MTTNPIQKEPALAVAGVVAAGVGVCLAFDLVNMRQAEAIQALAVVLIQALLTRRLVFAPETLRRAGLDPEEVEKQAEDPAVPRFEESKP